MRSPHNGKVINRQGDIVFGPSKAINSERLTQKVGLHIFGVPQGVWWMWAWVEFPLHTFYKPKDTFNNLCLTGKNYYTRRLGLKHKHMINLQNYL